MSYPRWLTEPLDDMNLREVSSRLYVGDERAPLRGGWNTIIDFYGHSDGTVRAAHRKAKHYLCLPFDDGDAFPLGALDAAWKAWQDAHAEGGDTLLHCQAGLSRSASAAYALLRKRFALSHPEALKRVVTPYTSHQFPMPDTLRSAETWVRRKS